MYERYRRKIYQHIYFTQCYRIPGKNHVLLVVSIVTNSLASVLKLLVY